MTDSANNRPPVPPGCEAADGSEQIPNGDRVFWDDVDKHWYQPSPFSARNDSQLPLIQDAAEFATTSLPEPAQLIHGVLHRGCKLALGGGSKTFKTWCLLDLALSVSHGEPWLGIQTARARACYVNLELPAWSFQSRMLAVAKARKIRIEPGQFQVWNLRGHATSYEKLLPSLSDELSQSEFGLLILDPIYKLYGDSDENSAGDISKLLNEIERLAQATGAAVAFASHFSKGNQSGKEAVDRISGSGVFARDPDAILTFTRHSQDGAFTVDSTLRNCSAVKPFVVQWDYPLMRRNDDLDPAELKKQKAGGRPITYTVQMLLDCLGRKNLKPGQLQQLCEKEHGMTRPVFYKLKAKAQKSGAISKNSKGTLSVSKVSKPNSDTSDTR